MSIQTFTISVSPFVIEDLRERIGRARWPDEITDSGWTYGTNKAYLHDLCTHWSHGFDWKEQEDKINTFQHFQADIDGLNLHFIHEKGKGENPIPLLLIHGYPDSFVRFLHLIPLLTEGGPDGRSFDVIVPSIPGFGFSDRPVMGGFNSQRIADLFARLMEELGYEKYIIHGGDWGSSIAEQFAINYPQRLMGLHLTDVPYSHIFSIKAEDLTDAEKRWLEAGKVWSQREGAYAHIQGTKPQTLAFGLNDSPIGLAAWIIEKFYAWTDHKGDLDKIYTRDQLLTNLTVYWVTQTIGSAFRLYYENMTNPPAAATQKIDIPTALCVSAHDILPPPREFVERIFNVKQWTQLRSGGHFAAMEQPEVLAEDLFLFASVLAPAGGLAAVLQRSAEKLQQQSKD